MIGLRTLWEEGETGLGAWLSMPELILAETAAATGYDYVCIDMQHGFSDYAQVAAMMHAFPRNGATPIVRVPWDDFPVIGRVLDAGAFGVIIPMVESAADAHRAVNACRYPPAGERSYGPIIVRNRYGRDYFDSANDRVACIPMIETRRAVENIDEILAVPGVDAIYVGPADLSVSMGLPPSMDTNNETIGSALVEIVAACQRHGKVAGIHAAAEMALQRQVEGFRMITVGADLVPAMQALQKNAATARAAVGKTTK